MREAVAHLVAAAVAMPPSPSPSDLAGFDRWRIGVRLRLNPSRREADLLDQRILAALKGLRTAIVTGRTVDAEWQIEIIESSVQQLLKYEWDKSKREAQSGRLTKAQG